MFKKRLLASYQYNIKLLKSVFDWTVLLYIAVPTFVIGIFLYRDFLLSNFSFSIEPVLFLSILFILSFFLCKSTIRLFLYEADLLFLRQNEKKIASIKMKAFLYSFTLHNIWLLFLIAVISPILISAGYTYIELLKVLVLLNGLTTIRIAIQYSIQKWYIRFPLIAAIHALFIFNFFSIPLMIYVLLFAISCTMFLKKMYCNRYWTTEILWEYEAYYKWMKIIYQFSMEMRYYLPAKQKPPLFIIAKHRTFSPYRIDNLVYKTLLRKFNYISMPLYLIFICINLLIFLPTWTKVLVILTTIFGLRTAFNATIKEIKEAPFFQLMTVTEDDWIASKLRLQKRILYPIIGLLCILFLLL